jgi:hypothetical protein
MPYEFQGENLVYVEPPKVTGYTWTSSGGGTDTAPTERWVRNADFDPTSILDIKTDKYGREVSTLKENASEADKRAYNLSLNYDPSDWEVKTEMQTGANPNWVNNMNKGWWNVDPAIQEKWQAANRANSGNAVGMSGFKDWIVPLSILAAGAGTAIGTGALAGEAAALGEAGAAGAMGPTYAELGYRPHLLTDASLGYTGAASELGLEGSVSGLTDLSGAQGSALLESMGLNTSGMSAADVLKTANQIRQASGTARTLANLLTAGGTASRTGGTGGMSGSQLASALSPAQQQFGGLYRMNQNPFAQTQQPTSVQTPFGKTQDFLSQLAEESKPESTLADLLRNA